jgi:hypothetical protein
VVNFIQFRARANFPPQPFENEKYSLKEKYPRRAKRSTSAADNKCSNVVNRELALARLLGGLVNGFSSVACVARKATVPAVRPGQ